MSESSGYPDIAAAILREAYEDVIDAVADAIRQSPIEALTDPTIQKWIARRYRNIFLTEAANDANALRAAKVPMPVKLLDRRSSRELLASRFLKDVGRSEAQIEMPEAAQPLATDTTLMFVPSLLTGLLPVLAFQSVWPRIEDRFGIRILVADAHPARSSLANCIDIENAFDQGIGLDADSTPTADDAPGDVILIGYSKGGADILTFLVEHPEYRSRVKALIGWAGVFGGSYIADETYSNVVSTPTPSSPISGQIGKLLRHLVPVVQAERISSRLDEYDVEAAVSDLTTTRRTEFLAENYELLHELNLPVFTFEGVTSLLEVPYYQAMGVLQLNNYNKNNDMFLTVEQARLPLPQSNVLATFRANHWDMAYDPFPWFTAMGSLNVDHKFARYPAMSALILLLGELGLLA